jgi:integrase
MALPRWELSPRSSSVQGHIRQRNAGSWRIKAYLGRDESTGRKRYAERTVKGTKREAQKALAKLVTEVTEGRYASPGTTTVNELLERWLELKAHQVQTGTHDSYGWIIERYLSPKIGSARLARLRTADLDRLYASLLRSGGEGGKPLSPRTVRLCHVVMRQALAQARRWGMLTINPADDATPPRSVHHEIVPPSGDEVARLLVGATEVDPDFGVYLRVLAATGCRRGEALALRWSDIQVAPDGSTSLSLARSIALSSEGMVEKDTKTHQSRRVVLDAGTVEILATHRRQQEERAVPADTRITAESFIFSNALDASVPWRPDVSSNRFIRLCKDLGISGVRLHDLRHYVATSLGAAGTPIATISTRLGHRDRATTLNVYSHSLPALDHQAADVIGALLDRTPSAQS